MAQDCIFCQIIKGEIPSAKIYEDDNVYAFLDIGPLSQGHCLLITRGHYETLDDCPADVLAALAVKLKPIASAVVTAVNANGYNILNNNGKCAGQLVQHLHFHIIPRNQGDGLFDRWPAGKYSPGQMDDIAKKIADAIASK